MRTALFSANHSFYPLRDGGNQFVGNGFGARSEVFCRMGFSKNNHFIPFFTRNFSYIDHDHIHTDNP